MIVKIAKMLAKINIKASFKLQKEEPAFLIVSLKHAKRKNLK
jgi:hypothetical protein